jgi:biotin carboxyl carrier protein
MNYIVTGDGRDHVINVKEVGVSKYLVTVDGEEHRVDAYQVQSTVWSMLHRNRSIECDVKEGAEGDFEVLIFGDLYAFNLMNEQKKAMARAAGKGGAARALLTSPMPGKVVKLLVAEGEEVAVDQGVIVVEAMKMENELKTAVAGKVKEIFVTEGGIVESGAKLLLVE